MNRYLFVNIFFLLLASAGLHAAPVTGIVNDASGEPLVGATVIIVGTTQGTVTDVDGAFSLDASVSSLGKGCFRGCSALKTIEFPSSFTEIPDEAFYGCISLEEIRCPATVMKIGKDAFGECVNAKEIYLDRSVQSIGSRAFAGCSEVASMTCLTATPPVCSADTFERIPSDIPVTVMMSCVENYRAAVGWNHFTNFKGIY